MGYEGGGGFGGLGAGEVLVVGALEVFYGGGAETYVG
jgi:hypothetical protein